MTAEPITIVGAPSARFPEIPRGHVRLLCDDPRLDLVCLLGPDPPTYSGAAGGWETVGRPRQDGMTIWQGNEPLGLSLSVMLDSLAAGATQEFALAALVTAARGDDESPPGVLTVLGLPYLLADRWVVDGLEFGDSLRRNYDLHRVRQQVTLSLRAYTPPSYLRLRKGALAGSKAKTGVYVVKRGDTPSRIARRRGVAWTVLRELNPGVCDKASRNLRDGSKIRVPVRRGGRRPQKGSTRGSNR
jgi:hypothetical protein